MNRLYSLAFGTVLIFALSMNAQQATTAPGAVKRGERGQQATPDDVPTADQQLKVLTIKLDLTDRQQAQIKPILESVHQATMKLEQDQSLSREERLAKVRPLRMKAHDRIQKILNDDQRKKLELYMQGPHPEMHGNLSGTASSPQSPPK